MNSTMPGNIMFLTCSWAASAESLQSYWAMVSIWSSSGFPWIPQEPIILSSSGCAVCMISPDINPGISCSWGLILSKKAMNLSALERSTFARVIRKYAILFLSNREGVY